MSDTRERVAKALCCAAAGDKTPTPVPDELMPRQWAGECGQWRAMADAALSEIFRSDGNEEARWLETCENACPACGGSGHKGDVNTPAHTNADIENRTWLKAIHVVSVWRNAHPPGLAFKQLNEVMGALDTERRRAVSAITEAAQ